MPFMSFNPLVFWLAIMIILFVIESIAFTMIIMWIATGAFFAGVMAVCGFPLAWQVGMWILVSVLCVFLTRPKAIRKD